MAYPGDWEERSCLRMYGGPEAIAHVRMLFHQCGIGRRIKCFAGSPAEIQLLKQHPYVPHCRPLGLKAIDRLPTKGGWRVRARQIRGDEASDPAVVRVQGDEAYRLVVPVQVLVLAEMNEQRRQFVRLMHDTGDVEACEDILTCVRVKVDVTCGVGRRNQRAISAQQTREARPVHEDVTRCSLDGRHPWAQSRLNIVPW